MFGKQFLIDEETLPVVEEIGSHMPGGFFIYKAEQPEELLFANQAVIEIFGCDDLEDFKQHTGFTFRGLVHPDDYASVTDSINKQIETSDDKMDYAEYRIVRKDGTIRWVDDYGHYAESDAYGGLYYVFISDITEKRERIENHIEEHRETIRTLHEYNEKLARESKVSGHIAQALADDYFFIYMVDPDTASYEEYLVEEGYSILGLGKSGDDFFEMSRAKISGVISDSDYDRFMETFNRENVMAIVERNGSFTTRYTLDLADETMNVTIKAVLMEDERGRHLVAGINNITPQVKREREYSRRLEEAQNKAKNDFLANMSHDIRTPMNAIIGYTNIASKSLDDHEVVKNSLEKIGSSSHFLLSLINDILDISKIESGKMQLNRGECDLIKILSRIEDITALQAKSKALDVSYDRSGIKNNLILADELRLEQVLINIVGNAIKYTPEGKSVAMTAEELPHKEPGMSRYRFVIKDTGIGISEDYLPYIFDSFTREHNTKTNRVQGTGLGLSITSNIVKMMGGTISVKSKLGEGSEFTVDLDLKTLGDANDHYSAETERPTEDRTSDLKGTKILLVEDNDINAEIAIMVLAKYGADVERETNGKAGLEKVADNPVGYYDAVLMDLQMPVMDGYEATSAIRKLEGDYYKCLPIIAISANAYDDDVQMCLDAGMNGHVAKPFQPEELLAKLKSYI